MANPIKAIRNAYDPELKRREQASLLAPDLLSNSESMIVVERAQGFGIKGVA